MLCQHGKANGKQIVPSEWIDDTLAGNPDIFGADNNIGTDRGAYRNQFWLRDVGRRIMMARGVFGQVIYVDLDNRLTIARLSSWPEFLSKERKQDDLLAFDAITQTLGGD